MNLRTFQLQNVIWADFRPKYRRLASARRPQRRSRLRLGRRSILSPKNIFGIRAKRLAQQNKGFVLHILGIAIFPFRHRRLGQRGRPTHGDEQPS